MTPPLSHLHHQLGCLAAQHSYSQTDCKHTEWMYSKGRLLFLKVTLRNPNTPRNFSKYWAGEWHRFLEVNQFGCWPVLSQCRSATWVQQDTNMHFLKEECYRQGRAERRSCPIHLPKNNSWLQGEQKAVQVLARPSPGVLHLFHTESHLAFSRTFHLILGIWERQGSNHLAVSLHFFWVRSLQQGRPSCPQECEQSTVPSHIILGAVWVCDNAQATSHVHIPKMEGATESSWLHKYFSLAKESSLGRHLHFYPWEQDFCFPQKTGIFNFISHYVLEIASEGRKGDYVRVKRPKFQSINSCNICANTALVIGWCC